MEKSKSFISRENTNIIKGIALIMMFVHHFYGFADWYVVDMQYSYFANFIPFIKNSLHLCVSVFAFMTGYFYYYGRNKTLKYSLNKIFDLWITYILCWGVMFLYGFIFKATASVNVNYFKELTAIWSYYIPFCWYVLFYITSMLILPLYTKISSKNSYFPFLSTITS